MKALHVNHQMLHPDELDTDLGDLVPMDENEHEESAGVETAAEVALLLARVQASRFPDAH
jgi:hypothetical protein